MSSPSDTPTRPAGSGRRRRLGRTAAAVSAIALVPVLAVLVPASAVDAAVLAVGPTEADLRAALATADANGQDDELVLSAGVTYDLTCPGGQLTHTANDELTITGNGATIRQTCDGERVFEQQGTGLVTVADLTMTGGSSSADGGAINAEGAVTVVRSTLADNENGAIDAVGDVTIVESTIVGNTHSDGIVVSTQSGVLTIVNSTVTGNDSVANSVLYGDDGVVLVYSTIVDNSGQETVRSSNTGGDETPSIDLFGTVIEETIEGGPACDSSGPITSFGYNFSTDDSCELDAVGDTPNGGDPGLGPLADNGGPTRTMRPADSSPLVDQIPAADCQDAIAAGVTTDQRGVGRPQDGACEIGSVELEVDPDPGSSTTTTTGSPSTSGPAGTVTPRFTG